MNRQNNCLSDEERVLECALSQGVITRNDVIGLLNVSTSTASRIIRRLVERNLRRQLQKARNTHYTVIDDREVLRKT